MFKKGLKIIFTLLGLVVGYIIAEAILAINTGLRINIIKGAVATTIFYILSVLLFGIIFYFISPGLYKLISNTIDKIEKNIQRLSAQEVIYGSAGLLIGLIIAAFIGAPLSGIFVGIHWTNNFCTIRTDCSNIRCWNICEKERRYFFNVTYI